MLLLPSRLKRILLYSRPAVNTEVFFSTDVLVNTNRLTEHLNLETTVGSRKYAQVIGEHYHEYRCCWSYIVRIQFLIFLVSVCSEESFKLEKYPCYVYFTKQICAAQGIYIYIFQNKNIYIHQFTYYKEVLICIAQ